MSKKEILLKNFPATTTQEFKIEYPDKNIELLNITMYCGANTKVFRAGHIFAEEQFILKNNTLKDINNQLNEYRIIAKKETLKVGDKTIVFSKNSGLLEKLIINNDTIIKTPITPNFWRAPTDNDYGNNMPTRCKIWKEAFKLYHLDSFIISKRNTDKSIVVTSSYSSDSIKNKIKTTYTIHQSGRIEIEILFGKSKLELPEIPRLGVQFSLPRNYEHVNYIGRGPHENYCDRKSSANIGSYISNIDNLFFKYGRPQESGHHTDVNQLKITNHLGIGINIINKEKAFEFNALPYSIKELDEGLVKTGRLPKDLKASQNIEVNIDSFMMGLGGDNSWGAKPHKEYLYYANKDYSLQFDLIPVYNHK